MEALCDLLLIEQDICKQQAVDYRTAYKIIKVIEANTVHLKKTPEFKHAKRSIITADKYFWSYKQYCMQPKKGKRFVLYNNIHTMLDLHPQTRYHDQHYERDM